MNKLTKVLSGVLLGAMSTAMVMSTATAVPFGHHNKLPIDKVKADLAVMILGSGDPAANPGPGFKPTGRAGSSFLIFADGVPVLMMDTGAGSFKSLALSGASIANVEAFLFTHLHLDHTSDMSGMVKSFLFHNLAANGPNTDNPTTPATQNLPALNFFGPNNTTTNNTINPAGISATNSIGAFDSMVDYVAGHYAGPRGLERYLNGFARAFFGPGTLLRTPTENLPVDFDSPLLKDVVTLSNGLKVESIAVKHGPRVNFTPAVAYRITYKGKSIVWSGDTDSSTENMITIGQDADVLIYDTAISEAPVPAFLLQFHTTPTRLGEVAAVTNPGKLVLAHLSGETESLVGDITATIRTLGYAGPILEGKDLKVINVW